MIFSLKKPADDQELASSLLRVVQQLLEGSALHAVEFSPGEHVAFRSSVRELARRFEQEPDPKSLLILTGEANKTVQIYNHQVEKFIHDLSTEQHLAVELLAQSLLTVSHASEKSARNLRQIERDLAAASQLQDMREIRGKLADCVGAICREADLQEAQHRELKERVSEPGLLETRDQLTGLGMLKTAESRIAEIANAGGHGYIIAFFLKNVDLINRRLGFSAGDKVLKHFAEYLAKSFRGKNDLFRWRGPCFVAVTQRYSSIETAQAEATRIGLRGPDEEVENETKSMLVRLTAATAVFPVGGGEGASEVSYRIDQFSAEQFKSAPLHKN